MSPITLTRTLIDPLTSKSKSKFFGDFRGELLGIISELEILLSTEIAIHFTLDSLITGANDIKIRVHEDSMGLEKIVTVIFRYHHDDEKYGNVHIEIMTYELSQRNKPRFLGKYFVMNRKKIIKNVCDEVIRSIRMQ